MFGVIGILIWYFILKQYNQHEPLHDNFYRGGRNF